jgi:hypothetical protein
MNNVVRMPKWAEHDNTKRIITQKKKTSNPS